MNDEGFSIWVTGFFVGLIIGFLLSLIIWICSPFYPPKIIREDQLTAIQHHAATWITDTNGEPKFSWLPIKDGK